MRDEIFGATRSEYLSQPTVTSGTLDRVEVGRAQCLVEGLHTGRPEPTGPQQRRQAGWVVADKPRMGAHAASAEEFGDQRLERRTDAGDLAQAT